MVGANKCYCHLRMHFLKICKEGSNVTVQTSMWTIHKPTNRITVLPTFYIPSWHEKPFYNRMHTNTKVKGAEKNQEHILTNLTDIRNSMLSNFILFVR